MEPRAPHYQDLNEEFNYDKLAIHGNLPSWLEGTLVRNGPAKFTVGERALSHWFDGLAMLHAFSFHGGEVSYCNRYLRSAAYKRVFEKGRLDYEMFAADPCGTRFSRFMTALVRPFSSEKGSIPNANVNVAKIAGEYVALTDLPLPVRFDLSTLGTLGLLEFDDPLPKNRAAGSAHPHYDAKEQATIGYLVEFGRKCRYQFYQIKEGAKLERRVFAQMEVSEPSYMHSFSLTESYAILIEQPLVVNPRKLLLSTRPFIRNFEWRPERGTHFHLFHRQTGKFVGSWVAEPFFFFHTVNAFEEEGVVHVDLFTYKDATAIDAIADFAFADRYPSDAGASKLMRYSLALDGTSITSSTLLPLNVELPRINPAYDARNYTYLYATDLDSPLEQGRGRSLVKIDTKAHTVIPWSQSGCCPGEPLFIAAPGATREDEGVVLAVVLDASGSHTFLLVLDATTFKEVARAEVPLAIPVGLHGEFFERAF